MREWINQWKKKQWILKITGNEKMENYKEQKSDGK